MDQVVNDANSQVSHLCNQMSGKTKHLLQVLLLNLRTGLQVDQDNLRRKNEELSQALRDKSRKLLQTQELYDKLKRRALLGQVQDAAHDAVDDTIHASSVANRFVDRVATQNQQSASNSMFQGANTGGIQKPGPSLPTGVHMGPPPMNRGGNSGGTWSGFSSQERDHGMWYNVGSYSTPTNMI
jgi:E3 ubiquitin-protein ligase CCNP1IP1